MAHKQHSTLPTVKQSKNDGKQKFDSRKDSISEEFTAINPKKDQGLASFAQSPIEFANEDQLS